MNVVAKIALFVVYMALLTGILLSLKEIILNYTDFSSWITPTMCYFLERLQVPYLLSTSIAFGSANWLKAKIANYWTN